MASEKQELELELKSKTRTVNEKNQNNVERAKGEIKDGMSVAYQEVGENHAVPSDSKCQQAVENEEDQEKVEESSNNNNGIITSPKLCDLQSVTQGTFEKVKVVHPGLPEVPFDVDTEYDDNREEPLPRGSKESEEEQRQLELVSLLLNSSFILKLLMDMQGWDPLLEICDGVKDHFTLFPDIPLVTEGNMKRDEVHESLRCQVPDDMLMDGYEPGEVKSDGNCFFHSLAWGINMGKDLHLQDLSCLLRVRAVVCGATEMKWFLTKFLEAYPDEGQLLNFIHSTTTDSILKMEIVEHAASANEKLEAVYKEEVKATTTDGTYSGLLQLSWLSRSLGVDIQQHCKLPGYDVYNQLITPQINGGKRVLPVPVVHILWANISDQWSTPNHIVPLIKTNKNGTFDKENGEAESPSDLNDVVAESSDNNGVLNHAANHPSLQSVTPGHGVGHNDGVEIPSDIQNSSFNKKRHFNNEQFVSNKDVAVQTELFTVQQVTEEGTKVKKEST